jgi:apoptosis-inducing factor 2
MFVVPRKNTLKPRLVIVGGGFGGLQVARRLSAICRVTVVDEKEFFENKTARYRMLSSPERINDNMLCYEKTKSLTNCTLDSSGLQYVDKAHVYTGESAIPYDYLVLAMGSREQVPAVLTTQNQQTMQLLAGAVTSLQRADQIAEQAALIERSARVAVLGGGPVGVEVAAELCDRWPEKKIVMVTGRSGLLARLPVAAARAVEAHFAAKSNLTLLRGARVSALLPAATAAAAVDGGARQQAEGGSSSPPSAWPPRLFTPCHRLLLESGDEVETDVTICCMGTMPNTEALRDTPLRGVLSTSGHVRVDPFLRVQDPPFGQNRIFAVGDIIDAPVEKTVSVRTQSA